MNLNSAFKSSATVAALAMAKGGGARQDHFIQNVIVVGALRLWGKLYVEKKYLNSDRKI